MSVYRGHEVDPFMLVVEPPQPEGIYLLRFEHITPEPTNPTEERRVVFDVEGKLELLQAFMSYKPLPGKVTATCRLKREEGRTGTFIRRFSACQPDVLPKGSRWQQLNIEARVTVDLDLLIGKDFAAWLVPEGDGMYLLNMANPTNRDELRTWTLEGAADA